LSQHNPLLTPIRIMFTKIYYNGGVGGYTPRLPRACIAATAYFAATHAAKKQSRVVAEAQKLVEYEKERDEYWKEQNELALEYASLEKQGLNTKYVYIPKGSRYLARFVRVSIAKTKILNDAKVQYEEQYGKI